MINNNEIRVFTNTHRVNEAEVGTEFKLTVTIPKDIKVNNLKVLFNMEGENPSVVKEMTKEQTTRENLAYDCYTAVVTLDRIGNYYYFFSFTDNYGHNQAIKLSRETNKPIFTMGEAPYFRILVVQKNFKVPEFAKGAIYYQLFVDRFYHASANPKEIGEIIKEHRIKGRNYRRWGEMPNFMRNEKGVFHNNDFFRGNLKGIEEKLSYFKSLSVSVLYISPINFSLYRYDRYATTNHMMIDPDVGTFEDLARLHRKANKMGIHIVLDMALNHCSSDNPIFKDAISNPNSPYRDWFYIDKNGNYRYWYGEFKDMPVFNQASQGYRDYVYGENGIIAKFAPFVDGFRLDVAEELWPDVLEGIRNRANEHKAHVIIAEYWNRAQTSYFGRCFDGTTNYLYTNAMYKWLMDGESNYFASQIKDLLENYPYEAVCTMLNSLDTHDIVRALTIIMGKWMRHGLDRRWDIDKDPSPWHKIIDGIKRFLTDKFRQDEFNSDRLSPKEYRRAKKLLKLLIILQCTLPGNPCIYYGTEVGLHGYKDPFNRKCFPWDHIDKDLLHYYKRIGSMYKQNRGMLKEPSNYKLVRCDDIVCYERGNLLIVVNRSKSAQNINIPQEFYDAEIIFASNNKQKQNARILGETGMILRRR